MAVEKGEDVENIGYTFFSNNDLYALKYGGNIM